MFVSVRRKKTAGRVYEYVDIVENRKVDGRVKHHRLGTLGRRDQLSPQKIDALIGHLRKLASPEGLRGISLGDMRIVAIREYGVPLVLGRLWREFGLDQLLDAIPQTKRLPVAEAVFRMVVNRLCDPLSKLGLVDWTDEQGVVHRGWQGKVQWPTEAAVDYHQYLLAMDRLHPHRERIEEALFDRATNLLSLPLRLCFYDLTSTYFEGDGACELAQYGYSRDHRDDRSQIVVGLAVSQEGLPITHRVYPGATVDVTTFVPMVEELRKRFGLQEAVIVADRGMFSADNIAEMTLAGQRYILALRARQQAEGELALDLAELEKLPRPKDVNAPWERCEVKLIDGVRHIVVYSAFKAQHDFEVRARRIRRALSELHQFKERAETDKLSLQPITERVARILAQHKCARYFVYEIREGRLDFRISHAEYCQQRRHDGIFVLETNHPELSSDEVVASYRQLMEVERAFRVLKSLLKLRPIYHRRDRRVETHIFICFLAYLFAKVIEQRLQAAGMKISVAHALDVLSQLHAVEHTWEGEARVIKVSEVNEDVRTVLDALGIQLTNPVLAVRPFAP